MRANNPIMVAEPARQIPVRAEFDVIVAGGGLGGVAAGVASARSGARTLLIERNSFVGGVATAGMCCSIFNCYYTRDHELGSTGIAVEVADTLAEAEGYGKKWHDHKGHVIYDIESAKFHLARMLTEAGAEILFDCVIAGALVENGVLKGVVIESKSGREAILAKTVVDATGDADVAAFAGAPVNIAPKRKHSLCFRMGNVDVDRFVGYFRDNPDQYPGQMDVEWTVQEALAQFDDCGTLLFPHGGGVQMDVFKKAKQNGDLPDTVGVHDSVDACQMHAIRRTGIVHIVTGFVYFDGLDIEMISRSLIDGRRMIFIVADVYRKYMPGFENAFIAGTAANLGIRSSRYIDGDFVFTADMMLSGVRQPDAVGRAVGNDHPVRHSGKGAWGVQALRKDSFDLPYRCLLPRGVDGLIMGAGRSVSTENPWLLRVMVHTMVVGQAAGTAAALAAGNGTSPAKLDVAELQSVRKAPGVRL